MDINVAIQILSVIAEAYATILSIVTGFFVFFLERHEARRRESFRFYPICENVSIIHDVLFLGMFMVVLPLILMWMIGESGFTSESLTIAIVGIIILAVAGFFSLYNLVIDIIEKITNVYVYV